MMAKQMMNPNPTSIPIFVSRAIMQLRLL